MNNFIANLSDIWIKLVSLIYSYDFIIDTIDILIVAFLVYKLIKFLRESRALHVVKGVILVLVAYFIIKTLDMQASTYLFEMLMSSFILVLVILFAPELRHALESVGRSRFSVLRMLGFNNRNTASQNRQRKAVLEICKACNEMSEKKIGALIVIEREIALNEVISTGVKIDADVSKELIGSIFFPNSPLHDGAVIIRDGRVCAAGCILPLTQNTNISSDLGTRHRASIGVSEQSDAVVVVVSEETGQISVVNKGNLQRDVSDGVLIEYLTSYFAPSAQEQPKKLTFYRNKGEKK
ncbi:MAG: diadenylate cyclase CdaA [Clostridia bacterium]|nr:diadenylate cyclase CdaA [Clostridia bacterium]